MSNTILTPTAVTRECLRVLHQKLNFIGAVNRQYDSTYKNGDASVRGKFGPTLNIRLPNEYVVRDGIDMAGTIPDVSETSVALAVSTVKGVDMSFTSQELALSIQDFSERIIDPAMSVLAANIEADALSMYKEVYNLYDSAAVAYGFSAVSAARQMLTDNLAPMDRQRTMVMNTTHATKFLNDTKGLFHDSNGISRQFREGEIGRVGGFDHYENTLLLPHTTGTAVEGDTTYDVNTSTGITSGSNTVTVATGSTTFLKGDVVTIEGVYRVHPETKVSTGVLQQFVVGPLTAGGNCGNGSGASVTSTGTSPTTIGLYPAPVTTGGRQNVTIASAGAGKALSKVGAGNGGLLTQSLGFHKDAFAFVTADLPLPQGVDWARREQSDGIAISLVRDFTIADRSFPCRLDVLYGYKAIRPQLACRVHADV